MSDIHHDSLIARWDGDIPEDILRAMYVTMLRIRKFEYRVAELQGEIICPCHLYIGQEAIAAGVCANLTEHDYVYSTHRSHGHYLAKGGEMNALMAEIYCRATGCSKGHGGSMHIASPEVGLPGSSAIVGGTIPIAVGTALAMSTKETGNVSVAFFGDGATNEGVFYESLNIAALKKLPVIFVCENNYYSTHLHISKCLADTDIVKKAEAFGVKAVKVEGNNVIEVYKAGGSAIRQARSGNGPTLLECSTYRWLGHVGADDDLDKGLRSREEWNYWVSRCPIRILEDTMLQHNLLNEFEKIQINNQVTEEVEKAYKFAKDSPFPMALDLEQWVYGD